MNEIKPSFSLKYFLLTALTALVIGGVGLGSSKIYDSRPKQEISVANGYLISLINNNSLPKERFEVEYFFTGEKRTKILSLFRKKVIIKNSGNVGVSDLVITAILRDEDAQLINMPQITSSPKEIIDTISVKKIDGSTDKKHLWNVSLLNPSETIIFEYSAFSEKPLNTVSLDIIPRKKDWKINYEELDFSLNKTPINTIYFLALFVFPIFPIFSILLIALPFYAYQWKNRVDYRKKYKNFFEFYNKHRPHRLFQPPEEEDPHHPT